MWFFFKQLTASLARSKAGSASARAVSASVLILLAKSAAILVYSSS